MRSSLRRRFPPLLLLLWLICSCAGPCVAQTAPPAAPATSSDTVRASPSSPASDSANQPRTPTLCRRSAPPKQLPTRVPAACSISWTLPGAWQLYVAPAAFPYSCAIPGLGRARHAAGLRAAADLLVPALVVTMALLGLPGDVAGHWLSRRYGQSIEGWGPWFWDRTKGDLLVLAIAVPLVWGLYAVIRRRPRAAGGCGCGSPACR